MAETSDPIALELFKNAVFSIADEMALTVLRPPIGCSGNIGYSTALPTRKASSPHRA